jgi:hypothetical protein
VAPSTRSRAATMWLWFTKNWHNVAALAAGIAALIAAWIIDSHAWPLFVVAIICLAVGTVGSWMQRPTYLELLDIKTNNERKLSEHQAALKGVLEASLRSVAIENGLWDSDSRLSCYSHNGEAFVMIARLSNNPSLEVAGRALYPEGQGVIGEAWKAGAKVQTNLPINDYKGYNDKHVEYGMDERIVKDLTMRSASLVGIRITDPRTQVHVGVMVAESTRALGVTEPLYKKIIESISWKTFQSLMCTSVDMLPNMSEAKKRGF